MPTRPSGVNDVDARRSVEYMSVYNSIGDDVTLLYVNDCPDVS